MRERLMTLACALGALLLFGTLFLREDAFTEQRVSLPTSTEGSDNGLLGVVNWLRAEGVTSVSLRERFGTLARRQDLEPTGNLMIVTLPAATNFRGDELIALDRWVRSGNTLLVLAALLDRPSWAQYPLMMKNDLQLLTGLRLVSVTQQADHPQAAASERTGGGATQGTQARKSARHDDQELARIVQSVAELPHPRRSTLLPNRPHPYFTGVSRALAFSDYLPRASAVSIPRDGFALSLAHQGETGADAFWIRPEGAGTVLVSAFGSLLVEIGNQDRSLTVTYNATIPTGPLNSAMWTTLFPTTTVYQARDSLELELANFPVISFPAAQINDFVTGQYASYEPDQVPTLDTLASVYGAITPGLVGVVQQERFRRLAAERMAPGRGGKAKLANDLAAMNTPDAFAAQAYYHLAGLGPQPAGAIPPLDFHKALTMIGQHGLLQRALGLVLDLEVPLASVQNTGGGVPLITGTVSSDIYVSILFQTRSLTAHATSVNTIEITPRTQCNASTTVFEAYPLSSQIVGRQLTLGDPSSFTINQVEVDGAGLRASHFGSTVSRLQHRALGQSSSASPTVTVTASPPSLRTEGILVCEVNRGINFQNLVARQQSLYASIGTGTVPDLQAEDLVRGYVLDVFDSTGSAWNSTAERSCTYMAGSQTVSGNDEASHQTPPRMQSSPTPGETTPQLNLSPVILRFTGWSTAAPRPFDVIPDADSMATAPTPSPFTASEITIAVVPVPGSVPRLRFGVSYALRARIVDVANNVLALSDGASVGDSQNRVSPLAEYLRLEPIGSPDIYDQSAPRLGETLQRLVIRDTDDSTPSVRALAPMPISAWFAEVHSMFDTGPGGALDPKAYGVITPAESKRYATTSPLAVGVTPPAISLTDPVPFLPDPVARGGALAVQNDAIAGDPTVSFDFSPAPGDSWPNYRPFGLRIAPGSQIAATVDTNARIVTFTLTPGDTVFLQLSSTCDVGDLKLFGL